MEKFDDLVFNQCTRRLDNASLLCSPPKDRIITHVPILEFFQDSLMFASCFFMKKLNSEQCVITLTLRYLTSIENISKKEEDIKQR
jgi:hypothetical protein